LQIAGEKAKQVDGFMNLAVVLLISLVGIYLALLVQFKNAVKPLLVFAAAPYGAIGAMIALAIMGTPFGFMAFLGVASLIGVIVSHVIVLFDFIEEMHEKGEPLERALPDAGIERIRPVVITVGANHPCPISSRARRRAALETPVLCPDRWTRRRYLHHLALGPGLYAIFVLDLNGLRGTYRLEKSSPLRLLLGSDAYNVAEQHVLQILGFDKEWKDLSISTDYKVPNFV